MGRTVVVGLDGSAESRAAAEWAAAEAELRGLPLRVVHVWEPVPEPLAVAGLLGGQPAETWREKVPVEAVKALRERHPGLEVTVHQRHGQAAEVLAEESAGAELTVLGSRGLGTIAGFMVGSVGLSVAARTERPLVLVRAPGADEDPDAAPARPGPVVVGVDAAHPDPDVLSFAFEAAARRGTGLKAVYGWTLPPYYVYALSADPGLHTEVGRQEAEALTRALETWREKHPDVEVTEVARPASASDLLVTQAEGASLVVVGRRVRRTPFGAHIGPVAHAAVHHVSAPVAIVAHH